MSTSGASKIKILFLGANPSNTTRLALGNEVREIMQRLRAAHQGDQFEFVQEWAVRVGDLQGALLRHRPQIVHFSGHGRGEGDAFSRSGPLSERNREMLPDDDLQADDGEILVEDDATRQARPLPASALAKLFKLVGGIRCVVLNACHSATQAEAICEHVEAVIGMRRSIHDAAAVNFAWAFYQGLGFGESLHNAFELGRNQIELAGFGDVDVPQFLTRAARESVHPVHFVSPESVAVFTVQKSPSWRPIELDRDEERIDPFLLKVERVAKLRHPGARMARIQAASPFAGVLEIEVDAGGFFRTSIVVALNMALTEELANRFCIEIDQRFRRNLPLLRSTLVHRGNAAPLALRARLDRLGIEVQTFDSYQGLFDLQRYLDWQARELAKNPAYLTNVYVDPPAWIKVAGSRELQHTDNALLTLSESLAMPQHRRFLLVLGEFGAGKTFLLRELCRQMTETNHPVVPVLLEMSKLEKQHSLAELLGAHFARADVSGYNFKAFEYMLGEGRIALFFDGFDELADKVTYDSATQHLDTVLSAAHGQAKIVLSSRRQHFLTEGDIHKAVEREFARKAESAVQGGYRLIMLQPFSEPQIRRYLRNVLVDEAAAEARYRLLDEVKDLIGLSHNPRMLSFISEIPEESLRAAKEQWGEITAAKLYELLVKQWLDFEHARARRQGSSARISRQALLRGVESLALSLWQTRSRVILAGEIHERIGQALVGLGEPPLDPSTLTHNFGSGSLLVRDEEGQFSFVHRSVMEWLVAKQAADELLLGQDPSALVADEMSALMADFFAAMAGRERTTIWARRKLAHAEEAILRKNATLLLMRMGERLEEVNFEGQDLRGKDFSGVDWRGANLRGADLREAMLKGADLRGASMIGANLSHADLRGAILSRVELADADLSFVRAQGVDLTMTELSNTFRFRGANLLAAKGIPDERREDLRAAGAAPPILRYVEPMYAAGVHCRSIAFSYDGSIYAFVYENGTIRLVDFVAGRILRILAGHTGEVRWVAFAPNGKLLASAGDDKTIRLWDTASGRLVRVMEAHEAPVHCVGFNRAGKMLISGSSDRTLRLWDVATGRLVCTYHGHTAAVKGAAFSPNDELLASCADDGTIRFWRVGSGDMIRVFEANSGTIQSIAFSSNGELIAGSFADGMIRVWDTMTHQLVHKAESVNAGYRVMFAHDGNIVAIGSNDDTNRLWQLMANRTLQSLAMEAYETYGLAFIKEGESTANAPSSKGNRMSRMAQRRTLREIKGHALVIRSVAFSADGQTLASGSDEKTIHLWDVPTGRLKHTLIGHSRGLRSLAFSPDGKTIATGSLDKTARIWDTSTSQCVRILDGHADAVYCVAFSMDGKYIATGSYDRIVRQWDITNRQPKLFRGHTLAVCCIAFSPSGEMLASGSHDSTVRLWDVGQGRPIWIFKGHSSAVLSVMFSRDGKLVASGSSDCTIQIWDPITHDPLLTLEGHTYPVQSVAFSPDGKTIASGSYDNTVRLWDVASGNTLHVFKGHASGVLSVGFSPDGKTIASGSYDNTVRLWDVATGQCFAILLATPEGWVAFTPDGRYKYGGNIAGSFWHVAGLCRFEPGELDDYLHLRLPDDAPFLPAKL